MIQVEATFNESQLQFIVDAVVEKLQKQLSAVSQTLEQKVSMEVLNVVQVAQKLHVNPCTVRNWIKQKKLKASMAGSKYQISKQNLDYFLERNNRYA